MHALYHHRQRQRQLYHEHHQHGRLDREIRLRPHRLCPNRMCKGLQQQQQQQQQQQAVVFQHVEEVVVVVDFFDLQENHTGVFYRFNRKQGDADVQQS